MENVKYQHHTHGATNSDKHKPNLKTVHKASSNVLQRTVVISHFNRFDGISRQTQNFRADQEQARLQQALRCFRAPIDEAAIPCLATIHFLA
ncbi:hypothetical protein M514_06897 [Trichuris suis]|uniref:Uncharacterized protein n=1 Tax=Trichuris suis TaxID=68888 RepID=A0A085NLM9_9BILA|nr:hypothetical protein M513_06897 [Trichuris suis]KFD70375.1 hypothetical protein M514_06897 [Trichuris suis]